MAKKRTKRDSSKFPHILIWIALGLLTVIICILFLLKDKSSILSSVLAARTVNVSSSAQLVTALKNAKAGDMIVLKDGSYSSDVFTISNKNGTANSPITIKSASQNKAIISGKAYFNISDSSYITIQGLDFSNTGTNSIRLSRSSYVRIVKNTFHQKEDGQTSNWIYITGSTLGHHTIERNLFENKTALGRFILIAGDTATGASRNNTISYNHFRNTGPYKGNGMEAITVGSSALSTTYGGNRVEYNLFENCTGDAEVISLKSNNNIVRFNTFRNNEGSISVRQANGSEIYGNFILGGKSGIRIYGKDTRIFNNYIEGTIGTGNYAAINVGNGDVESLPNASNANYARVVNTIIAFNTLVNNTSNIEIGNPTTGNLTPRTLTFANNLITSSKNKIITLFSQPDSVSWSSNIFYPTGTATVGITLTPTQVQIINPLLTPSNNLQKLSSKSPLINKSIGDYSSFLNKDMDGQDRSGTPDIGADEYSSQAITRVPLTPSLVGPFSN